MEKNTFSRGDCIIPSETGNYKFSHVVDGKTLPHIILEEPIAKRCLGFCLIEEELKQAIELVKLIDPKNQPKINLSLWHTVIMNYSRCFTKTWGRGIKLEKQHYDGLYENSTELHDYILYLRNEYVAHSGNNSEVQSSIVLGLEPATEKKQISNVYYLKVTKMGPNPEIIKKVILHFELLSAKILKIRIKAENKLLEKYKKMDINELYDKAVL